MAEEKKGFFKRRLVQKGGVYHGFYIILYHRCYGRCDLPSHLQMVRQAISR